MTAKGDKALFVITCLLAFMAGLLLYVVIEWHYVRLNESLVAEEVRARAAEEKLNNKLEREELYSHQLPGSPPQR